MKEAVTQSLFAYWNRLRGSRLAPSRFEIEPSAISAYLPDTFILERVDARTARFRLAGTRISDAFGIEFRGANVMELFDRHDQIKLQREIEVIAGQGGVGIFVVAASSVEGLTVNFEFLLLPLTHSRGVVDRFLGSIAPIGRPKWLGTVPLTQRKILSHDIIWPDGHPPFPAVGLQRQTPLQPHIREARIVRSQRRQFRVYEGGLGRRDEK